MKKAIIIVLDSLGIGNLPDSKLFGDSDCNTLKNISEAVGGLHLPNLEKMGIGNLTDVLGVSPKNDTLGAYGKLAEISKGKDTTTGHWELMGVITEDPMPTFPDGFPDELINKFKSLIGRDILGNEVASGTEIIERLGKEHMETGFPIVYTSADSVFQIAAHEDIIPVEDLYKMCKIAREMLDGPYKVGRVIARPFIGTPGNFTRTSNRHDYSLMPPKKTLLDTLKEANKDVFSVGKIFDIFAGSGLTKSFPTKNNMDGVDKTIKAYEELKEGLVFTNLVEFDSKYGHRNNPEGYGKALEDFDKRLPELWDKIDKDTILILVADHGNDPTTPGTDHTREYVPLLIMGDAIRKGFDFKIRASFGDLGATLADYFEVTYAGYGESIWNLINNR